ncbi:MAG: baseplate J/gp47 family protein [Proteobacteria bacterium]|nr:baseplate J/gp47 family protein [Pseudomonadota bacterium]
MIDLNALPAPAVLQPLDYEAVLAGLRADMLARYPALREVLDLESEPVAKLLEVAAYRELLIRARINDAARAVLLPWAVGTDLDNLAARYDLQRLPGEDDERLRARVLIGYHALSAAGSPASWRLRALSVSTDIRQVDVWSDRPGRVKVALLARVATPVQDASEDQLAIGRALFGPHPAPNTGWCVASSGHPLIASTTAALLADDVRPLTVDIDVTAAQVLPMAVQATLVHPPGPDAALIAAAARQRLQQLAARSAFRVDVTRAALVAALMGDGVRDVRLTTPAQDQAAGLGQIVAISAIDISTEARLD